MVSRKNLSGNLLVCAALLLSCAKETEPLVQPVQGVKTYTLTVKAGKGERPDTKALDFVGTKLNAFWLEGEEVSVYKADALLGTLSAQGNGTTTTLKGQVSGDIRKDDVLTLKFLSPDYANQDGTIQYIAAHCDYAVANVTVTNVEEGTVTTDKATFQNQQAIVSFNLNVNAKPLIVNLPSLAITVTPADARANLFVAVPAISSKPISLRATVGDKQYTLLKNSVTLEVGKYYSIDATLSEATVVHNESELTAAVQTDKAQILFANDIAIANLLEIKGSRTVTLDMNGYTLDRGCITRASQVIVVRTGSTLNLCRGTLTGGWGGNGGALDIESGTTVNLTDVTISGNIANDRGGGISNKGTLTMVGGAITNNVSDDNTSPKGGGGLFNYDGAVAKLTGVTITGNEAKVHGGGGIFDIGKLSLEGCTIQNNTARTCGGGVWHGDDHVSGLELNMQGVNLITDNIAGGITGNLFLTGHRKITCTGSLKGSRIGVSLAVYYYFTDGYSTYHSGDDFSTIFLLDRPEMDCVDVASNGEVIMRKKELPTGSVPYIERRWDSENQKVRSTTKMLTTEIDWNAVPTSETQYKKLRSTDDDLLYLGTENSEVHEFFVVEEEEVNVKSLFVQGPNVHIILCDEAKLHFEKEIKAYEGHTIYIHAQSSGSSMGKLVNDNNSDVSCGLGGADVTLDVKKGGNIEIHGGNLDLSGGEDCAAIGGDYTDSSGDISIFDGHIKVVGGDASAGIGGGKITQNYGNINIYDAVIDATGGPYGNVFVEAGGPGIGGGANNENGNLTIWNGSITARGDYESAGIGGAQWGGDFCAGTIIINGGIVKAYGDDYGAGIGGGDGKDGGTVIINGGHVEAYGGTDAAGIGGGEGGNGGFVKIHGGYVYAQGNSNGSGIGAGEDGNGGEITIDITSGNPLYVEAVGGSDISIWAGSIGSNDSEKFGTLNIGNGVKTKTYNYNEGYWETIKVVNHPVTYVHERRKAVLFTCDHAGYTAQTCPYCTH